METMVTVRLARGCRRVQARRVWTWAAAFGLLGLGMFPSGCTVQFRNKAACGDGVVAGDEECDDGNTEDGDGCNHACTLEVGWECSGSPSSCSPTCGDGFVVGDEECDGQILTRTKCEALGLGGGELSCGQDCRFDTSGCERQRVCGNGRVEKGEDCDGTDLGGGTCEALGLGGGELSCGQDCRFDTSRCGGLGGCGDGELAAGEECDDGNVNDGDGCSHACTVEEGWDCHGEPSSCSSVCGDGLVVGDEECDDGAGNSDSEPDACRMDCRRPWCGDGTCDSGELWGQCVQDCAVVVGDLAAGWGDTCAVKTDGTVWCWGWNHSGELGNGTTRDASRPVRVSGLSGAFQVSVDGGDLSGGHTCAVKTDGTVWCWGWDEEGELGDGTTEDASRPVQVVGLSDVLQVSAGGDHTCAVKTDGTVWCWGWNHDGELGDGTTTDSSRPVRVSGLSDASQVSTGGDDWIGAHTCAVKTDGTVWCWGNNHDGELGDGTTTDSSRPVQVSGLSGTIQVSAGALHTCAVKGDGTVWCWGNNYHGQLGDGTTTERHSPVQALDLSDVSQVFGGWAHTCALKNDGTVWCWGWNKHGQLGDGTTTARHSPVQVSGLSGISRLSVGAEHTCALKNDGTVWCWGWNEEGELGDGTKTNRHSPVQVVW